MHWPSSRSDRERPQMPKPRRKPGKIIATHPVDDDTQVVTIKGGAGYRVVPCLPCPWRVDQTGAFPAEAFRASAYTAYDMSTHEFACHVAGADKPTTCAGFLLNGAEHNLATRMKASKGELDWKSIRTAVELHPSYRAMAIANGVDPDDPVLAPCRDPS